MEKRREDRDVLDDKRLKSPRHATPRRARLPVKLRNGYITSFHLTLTPFNYKMKRI